MSVKLKGWYGLVAICDRCAKLETPRCIDDLKKNYGWSDVQDPNTGRYLYFCPSCADAYKLRFKRFVEVDI